MIGTNDDVGVCGFLWPTCSRLVRCNSSDYSCLQPNTICVQHPQCDDFPLCYPVGMIDQNMCPPTKNKSNLKWKQNAITVAGGNGRGQQLNQKHNAKEGQVIAGGNGQGKRIDQLSSPMAMILDQQNHSIIITDQGNWRVIQWSSQKQQILIDNIFCYNLAMDKYGFLYVSNWNVGEVRRWKMGEYKNEGIVVAGGNGKGNQLNQLNHPTFIFVDKDQSVYVTDYNNGRVMKWKKDAKEGIVVAGGNGGGGNLNQLLYPHGVIVDHLGQVYVVDKGNNRVMRWCEGKEEGEIVVGGNGQGGEPDQLSDPTAKYHSVVFIITSDDKQYCRKTFGEKNNVLVTPDSFSAVDDLATLTQCKHIILTVGTFGLWGAFLSHNRLRDVITDSKPDHTPLDVDCRKNDFFPSWFSFLNNTN
ncbi:unnamed protein product [Adineta steineri]|uniref:L-Fucosyltransferase n=1 Tax=Adineta steineri TaxID=433720 RepID=A0A813SAD5_9BILA|nr:unnamed protein product [Adineta steineri]